MNIKKEKISEISGQEVFLVSITNDNNFSVSFSNFGGYIHQVLIPYQNNPEEFEDVILGYEEPIECVNDKSFFNVITGRVCNRIKDANFVLNNKKYGPIPGAYMVMCTKPGKEWCVAQLNADRAKPFILYEDKVFTSIEEAQKAAEKIKKERGETAPRRCT